MAEREHETRAISVPSDHPEAVTSEAEAEPAPFPPPRPAKARPRTLGGAMLAAAMVGLQEALEGPKEQPAIIEVGSGAGNDDDPVAVDLDPEDPSQSIAVVRPWLQK